MTVDTKTAPRRTLRFDSFEDFERDLDAIEASHKAGTLKTTGNWGAGQIMEHLTRFGKCALDGFQNKAPWPIRKIFTLMYKKKMLTGDPMPSGYKLPKQASYMLPEDGTTTEEGIEMLRAFLLRVQGGEKFKAFSPIFGQLTHEEWCKAQLGHAAMHMSFIEPGGADGAGGDGG